MAPNAAEPSRTPVPAPDTARPDENGDRPNDEERTAAPPIEPSFRHFAESLSDLVWSARPDGYSDYYNRRFLDYVGRTADEMGGWTWTEMLHLDDADAARRAWQHAAATAGEFEIEFRLRRHDGAYRWHRSRGSAMRDEAGRITRWLGTCTDIDDRRQDDLRLREGEERLRLALAAGRMGTWDWDIRAGRVAWSDNVEELHGLPPGGFDGTMEGFRGLVHPEDLGRVEAAVARAVEGASGYEAEFRIVRPDGSVGWMLSKGQAFADGSGSAGRMVGVGMDITERKRAEELLRLSERRFGRFMQHLPGLAWIKDSLGRYIYANDDAVRAFGVTRQALYGRTDEEVFPPGTAAEFREHDRRAVETGAGIRVIETLEHPDGTVHHSLVSKFPIPSPDGENVLVGGMAIDVTDRLEMEIALKEADRRKDEFLATLAHELRNPLAPIRNGLQIMRMAGDDRQVLAESRELIERQVAHMVRLVDDLLDVSRITRGKLELRKERVDLASVVRHAVETSRPLIEESRHELALAIPPAPIFVDVDVTRISQVFSNLLNNAAKYTEPGGAIALAVERRGGEVAVTVRDNGVGIPPEMMPRVFDLFTQVDRTLEKSRGGLGVGLTIVKRLVEMHGGRVDARSEGHGAGSEFVVRLPVVSPAVQDRQEGTDRRPARRPAGYRILVVDDNADAAASLAMVLKLMGHEVRTARDGLEALSAAEGFGLDVILLDIGMPNLNGYDACRRIRERPRGKDPFIVALTGWGQDEDRRRSHEAGFDHHLVKPVEPAALEELLASVASRKAGSAG